MMCDILNVSRNGYYDWRGRPQSPRAQKQQQLCGRIREVFDEEDGLYGSPRICAELDGIACVNTVARLMKKMHLAAKTDRRFIVRTTDSSHGFAVADNLLDRNFQVDRLDQVWCSDITYIPTDEGWLYLAAVMDLCSRRIVGWAIDDHLRADLCCDALSMAISSRDPSAGLLHHSDRGVQYACNQYQDLLEKHQMICSMSRRGNCYDNAAMESFFGSLKREWVYQQRYSTKDQARSSVFEYIEVYYNRQRRHSSLGYVSPVAFEAARN
jgi:transposase InsO family protein